MLSSEAQVEEVEGALAVYEDRVEALSAGGVDDCAPAQRCKKIMDIHTKFEKTDRVKDSGAGTTTGESLGLSKALVSVLESQSFQEVAAGIGNFLAGSVDKDGGKKEMPLVVDVFLRCMASRYRFLTGSLLGRVSLSLQATQHSPFLGSLAAVRMTGLM